MTRSFILDFHNTDGYKSTSSDCLLIHLTRLASCWDSGRLPLFSRGPSSLKYNFGEGSRKLYTIFQTESLHLILCILSADI